MIGEVKQKSAPELFEKFDIKATPAVISLTDPYNYKGEAYDTADMKID